MGTIKLRRGSGSPAGSLAQYEVAMDVAAKNLYVSTNGSDAEILADNTENFLETNTTELDITSDIDMNSKKILSVSGFKNNSTNYGQIAQFQSTATAPANTTGIELARNLGSSGAAVGRDIRGSTLSYAIYSDAGNTNGSSTYIYPGGIAMQSGDGNGNNPHWMVAFTYDNGISSYSEEKLWDGSKDEFHVYPPTEFHAPVQFPSYAIGTAPPSSPVAGMQVYNTDTNKMAFYNGTTWTDL